MDAHLLHALAPQLEVIVGSRITKIYQYDNDIFVIGLYRAGKKQYVIARTGKNCPFLFLSEHHTARGEVPTSHAMRLRKYLKGRRIINMYSAWWERTIYFQIAENPDRHLDENSPLQDFKAQKKKDKLDFETIWFKIDIRKGVDLCRKDFDPFTQCPEPPYPSLDTIEELEELLSNLDAKAKNYSPYFTPVLRKTLHAMFEEYEDKEEAFLEIKSLFIDLESGNGDIFLYTDTEENQEIYAWQLPQSLKKEKEEEVFSNILFALTEYGKSTLHNSFSDNVKKEQSKPHVAQIKKLQKLKTKIDDDENRLLDMYNQKNIALILQSNLYAYDKDEKKEFLEINGETINLNKRLTIRENMENLFHQSLRGKRGLVYLETRRQDVESQLEQAKETLRQSLALSHTLPNTPLTANVKNKQNSSKNNQNTKSNSKQKELPKQVLLRESVDGFSILLGKDIKGNKLALKLASPHDYWLHTADGASAHAIIKRDHAAVVVPQSTFEEAGRLVAEKSPFKHDEKVLIQYAYAKNIQNMKNAPAGLVRIVKSEGSFWVGLE